VGSAPPTDAQVIAGTVLGIAGMAINASMLSEALVKKLKLKGGELRMRKFVFALAIAAGLAAPMVPANAGMCTTLCNPQGTFCTTQCI